MRIYLFTNKSFVTLVPKSRIIISEYIISIIANDLYIQVQLWIIIYIINRNYSSTQCCNNCCRFTTLKPELPIFNKKECFLKLFL